MMEDDLFDKRQTLMEDVEVAIEAELAKIGNYEMHSFRHKILNSMRTYFS